MVDIEKLKKFKIFKDLNQRELELIANIAEYEAYEAGKRIFEEKALATTLYLTLEGKIEIKIRGDGTEQIVIDQVEPGEIFGWSAVTEPYTFTAAAWTLEKTKFITFSGERLKDLFDKNNHIGYRVVKEIAVVISRRLKAMESKFVVTLRMKK
ncbi:MAG: cyclic nucleotide-binding domain-containing protein [Candidatus Stahlbacteria bacterium]|nr:MAG: cyclic nucleotide-binding domain-containing protein [Candidatus Stahlbacteria bacterium]